MSSVSHFGILPDGREVRAVEIVGKHLSARILTLGATVQDLRLQGVNHPLVLGFDDVNTYLNEGIYVGAIVGRFANRLGGARFKIDDQEYHVDANFLQKHLLHGGRDGVHTHLWQIADICSDRVALTLELAAGHMGFPGTLNVRAEIAVADNALDIKLTATCDTPTLCNFAHHGYYDLDGKGDIRTHLLQIEAEDYLPVNDDLIPTGEIAPIKGTEFDFTIKRAIKGGYDHNFCLSRERKTLRPVAQLSGNNGLSMMIKTTETGLQLYDGRHFAGLNGLNQRVYNAYAGVALETQAWPDAPNHRGFPDAVLRPEKTYFAHTRYAFTL